MTTNKPASPAQKTGDASQTNPVGDVTGGLVEALKVEVESLKVELETLRAINEDLQAELDKRQTEPVVTAGDEEKVKSFELEGATYDIVLPGINHKGSVIGADEVIASEELQRQLIRRQSGMIRLRD